MPLANALASPCLGSDFLRCLPNRLFRRWPACLHRLGKLLNVCWR